MVYQVISKEKSDFYPSKNINLARRRGLLRMSVFVEGSFPVISLGFPLVTGRLTTRFLETLVAKIVIRLWVGSISCYHKWVDSFF